jgi:hypothetical protein
MGDRANVLVRYGNSKVYLYTHWDGTDLPKTVKKALKRGESRWNDGQYLARIIFSEMIKGSVLDLTGYGISSEVGDGDNRIVEVDVNAGVVRWDGKSCTFRAFIELEEPEWSYDESD